MNKIWIGLKKFKSVLIILVVVWGKRRVIGETKKTDHPPICVWMMWYSLLRTALGPMERKTFVPVQEQ